MIGSLVGRARNARLVQTSSGVGYVVNCITPLTADEEVDLIITTIVKEDSITLYGFNAETEQTLFEELIKVSGVGPATAMGMLSELGVAGIVNAIKNSDSKTLAKTKGISVMRADVIRSTMKLPKELMELEATEEHPSEMISLAKALTGLGYDEKLALNAAKIGLAKSSELSEAMKTALSHLRSSEGK